MGETMTDTDGVNLSSAQAWDRERRFVWCTMILSAWFVTLTALVALAFGYHTLGLAVTALVMTIVIGLLGVPKLAAK
jgi:hypothetical protein